MSLSFAVRYASCIDALNGLLSGVAPSDSGAFEFLSLRARIYHQIGRYSAELADRDAMMALTSLTPDDRLSSAMARAACLESLGDYARALAEIKEFISNEQARSKTEPNAVNMKAVLADTMPLLRTLTRCVGESEGRFDLTGLTKECFTTANQVDGPQFRRADLTPQLPSAKLGPHANFIDHRIALGVRVTGAGRGVRAKQIRATSELESASTSAASATQPCVAIPANTLLLASKPLIFIESAELVQAAVGSAAAASGEIQIDGKLYLRKVIGERCRRNPSILSQLFLLDGGPKYDSIRSAALSEAGLSSDSEWTRATPQQRVDHTELTDFNEGTDDGQIDYEHVEAILHRNTFTPAAPATDDPAMSHGVGEHGALGIWLLPSLFNHSCHPNAIWFLIGDMLFVRSIRPIMPGEEVTISYADVASMSFAQRQASLSKLGFQCACEWCRSYVQRPALLKAEASMIQPNGRLATLQADSEAMRQLILGTASDKRAKLQPKLVALIDRMQSAIDAARVQVESCAASPIEVPHPSCVDALADAVASAQLTLDPASDSSSSPCRLTNTHLYPSYLSLAALLSLHVQLALSGSSSKSVWSQVRPRLEQLHRALHAAAEADAIITGTGFRSNLLTRLDALRMPIILLSHQLLPDDKYNAAMISRMRGDFKQIVADHCHWYGADVAHFRFWYEFAMQRCQIEFDQWYTQ